MVAAARVALLANQLLLAALLRQALGVAGLGLYFLMASLSRVAQVVLEAGIPELLATATRDSLGSPRDNIHRAALLQGRSTVLLTVLAFIAGAALELDMAVVAAALLGGARSLARSVGESHRALGNNLVASSLDGLGDLPFLSLALVIFTSIDSVGLVLSISAATSFALAAVFYLKLPRRSGVQSPWNPHARHSVTGTRLSQQGLSYADVPLLAALTSAPEVAVYGVASRFALAVSAPLSVANQLLLPSLISALGNQSHAIKRVTSLVRGAFTVSVVLAITAVATAPYIGTSILGSSFDNLQMTMAAIVAGQVINAATGPCILALVYSSLQRHALIISTCSAAVALAAALASVPAHGAPALAASFAGATCLQNLAAQQTVQRRLGLDVSILGKNP